MDLPTEIRETRKQLLESALDFAKWKPLDAAMAVVVHITFCDLGVIDLIAAGRVCGVLEAVLRGETPEGVSGDVVHGVVCCVSALCAFTRDNAPALHAFVNPTAVAPAPVRGLAADEF